MFGAIVAVLVGLVIIGGIVWIARVTEFLVPIMCVTYVIACLVVLLTHASEIPAAFGTIFHEAFSAEAGLGGLIGGIIQGIRRGVFSNEAGVGLRGHRALGGQDAQPRSEGLVALLEPFVDTVIVCTMTALVIVITGMWKINADVADDSLALLNQPAAGAEQVVTYEEGTMLHIEEAWQKATSEQGVEGWITVGTLTKKKDVSDYLFAGKKGAELRIGPREGRRRGGHRRPGEGRSRSSLAKELWSQGAESGGRGGWAGSSRRA